MMNILMYNRMNINMQPVDQQDNMKMMQNLQQKEQWLTWKIY